jgi:hypothetical protein
LVPLGLDLVVVVVGLAPGLIKKEPRRPLLVSVQVPHRHHLPPRLRV